MLPQYMALSVSLVLSKKICVSVHWVTLWVCPPPVKICVSVRWGKLWVRPPPLCEDMCVRSLVTLWVRPPLVCVLSLDPCMLPFLKHFSELKMNFKYMARAVVFQLVCG